MIDKADAVLCALLSEMTAPEVAAAVSNTGTDCDTNMAHAALMCLLAAGKVTRRNRRPYVWSPVDKGLRVAVERTLSTVPITALDVARRVFESPENHRARNVNPSLYALEREGKAKNHPTHPPTWSKCEAAAGACAPRSMDFKSIHSLMPDPRREECEQ